MLHRPAALITDATSGVGPVSTTNCTTAGVTASVITPS